MKKLLTLVLGAASVFAVSMTVSADEFKTPAELLASLVDKDVDTLVEQKIETGKTYTALAQDYGVFDEFKDLNLESKFELMNQNVVSGKLTREEADLFMGQLTASMEECDGTSENKLGQEVGIGNQFGYGNEPNLKVKNQYASNQLQTNDGTSNQYRGQNNNKVMNRNNQ